MKYFFILLFFSIFLYACGNDHKSSNNNKILAKVANKQLKYNDLIGFVPSGTSKNDSALMMQRYIESWVRKQLLLEKANKEVKIDEAEIERKLQDYKYDLIVYQYEKNYIQKNLDTIIKPEEIQKYYQENTVNFELKQNIIKGIWVKTIKENTEKEQLKALLSEQKLDLEKIAKASSESQILNEKWIDFDTFVKNTPFQSIVNKTNFIQNNRLATSTEGEYTYYLLISDFKITNQPSPLEFVKNRIVSMIINQRKAQLLKNLEKNTYEQAKKNKEFEIFK
ncbi:MAG: peptidyl-prolyl cis-trans isomerase [Cytophagia bacterium]|nr:MAG: peptidyl-prolyl cis-trans isomerase [Cytophagia bacterium]